MTYVVISPQQRIAEAEGVPDLETLHDLCGGYVKAHALVRGGEAATLWLNEEGKANRLPLNPRATRIAHDFRGLRPYDYVCGTAVITGPGDDEGEMTSLSDRWITYLGER